MTKSEVQALIVEDEIWITTQGYAPVLLEVVQDKLMDAVVTG